MADRFYRTADSRPRLHLWPHGDRWAWSKGPTGVQSAAYLSRGMELDAAYSHMPTLRQAVVIVEAGNG